MSGRRNVVLVGFMGTGKSTVGQIVAAELGFEFLDTDAVIEDRHGPIAQIFADDGEATFRTYERDVTKELAGRSGLVVATGGGLVLDPSNIAELIDHTDVFCLVASAAEVLRRVSVDGSAAGRPLLASPDPEARITELLDERADAYGRFPQINTANRSPSEIAKDIINRYTAGADQASSSP